MTICLTGYNKPEAASVLLRAARLLLAEGTRVVLAAEDGFAPPDGAVCLPGAQALTQADAVVTVGGDGTMLHAAKECARHGLPVLGINLGRTGFLATCELDEMEQKLHKLAAGEFSVEHRALLQAECTGADGPLIALNDLVVYSGHRRQTVDLDILCDGLPVSNCRGDGVILATPTGSTAYSLSAGGPILDARIRGLVVTSICAHSLQRPAIVFAADRRITVRPGADQRGPILISSDGEREIELSAGGELRAGLSEKSVKLITFNGTDQFDAIDKKLRGR